MTPDEWMDGDDKPAIPEMTPAASELAARIKETFYAYTTRSDRSQQHHLGPSEVGTPCDRQLALHVLGMQPCNPGGDNWAAFKGTCVHAGLADMFTWADGGTGRYAVEVSLALPSALVPRGTADLIDRTMCMLDDHKTMGNRSLDKLRRLGPTPKQYIQVHLYAYAARRRGERVEQVALIAWPIEGSSLDDLHVWVGEYDPTVAPGALARVERIAAQVRGIEDSGTPAGRNGVPGSPVEGSEGGVLRSNAADAEAAADGHQGVHGDAHGAGRGDRLVVRGGAETGAGGGDGLGGRQGRPVAGSIGSGQARDVAGRLADPQGAAAGRELGEHPRGLGHPHSEPLRIASEFDVADDCRYCPYYAPDDHERTYGCNGKK